MRPGRVANLSAATLALFLASCHSSPPRAPVLGVAYVGPATLTLRSDIPTQSTAVVTVKHGDRVQIVQQRRSFLKVRAPNGAEGWTDQRQLLAADDMATLKAMAERAAAMPSQGRATADAELRVHMQPAAQSPSFLILKENDKVDVLTHIVRSRSEFPRKPLIPPVPKKAKATKKSKQPQYPPPPPPTPPAPPANWIEMSKTGPFEDDPPPTPKPGPQAATDDWSLVRAADGQSGWVLTRRLRMALPDEVYQYAEGRRIVSYFSLGTVRDGDLQKDIWLWTTVGSGSPPYDFDGIRIFVWSTRRHRYETEHIERNLIGFAPVLLQPVHVSGGKSHADASEPYAGFSICVQKKDGQLVRRQYAVMNTLVRVAGEEPCVLPPPVDYGAGPITPPAASTAAKPAAESFMQRAKRRLKSMFGH